MVVVVEASTSVDTMYQYLVVLPDSYFFGRKQETTPWAFHAARSPTLSVPAHLSLPPSLNPLLPTPSILPLYYPAG